jgi:pyridinium-3,5-biscarboxylic acid mononucleotide sulfurtransferase
VMAVAHEQLGERALACIGVSPSYPTREMRDAVKLAELIGVPYRLVNTEEHLDPNYAANPTNRCYFCKSELHDRLHEVAEAEGWAMVVDGNNASDLGDFRPGMDAARERGVRSPLLEVQISKAEVRELARHLGLPVWDKPAMACLSSRVPHGTAITPELLRQIEGAEDVLVELGFSQVIWRCRQAFQAICFWGAWWMRDGLYRRSKRLSMHWVCPWEVGLCAKSG